MTRFSQQILVGLTIFGVLFTQTSCVGAVMAAAYGDEVADRAAIKRWILDNAADEECKTQAIAPEVALLYYDFNQDGKPELIVTAATCMTGTAGPDIHTVLTRESDGSFKEWPLEDISQRQAESAHFVGNRNYRLSVEEGKLMARWRDRSGRKHDAMVVTYKWTKDRFTIDAIHYPQ